MSDSNSDHERLYHQQERIFERLTAMEKETAGMKAELKGLAGTVAPLVNALIKMSRMNGELEDTKRRVGGLERKVSKLEPMAWQIKAVFGIVGAAATTAVGYAVLQGLRALGRLLGS